MKSRWSTAEVSALTNTTKRQLNHWVTRRVVKPLPTGTGNNLEWSYLDLIGVSIIKELRDFGLPLSRIKPVIDGLDDAIDGTVNLYLVVSQEDFYCIDYSWTEYINSENPPHLRPDTESHLVISISYIMSELNYRLEKEGKEDRCTTII